MLIASGLLVVNTSVHANVYDAMSLDEALDVAFQNNPKMTEARNNVKISEGKSIQVKKFLDPEVSLEIGDLRKDETGSRDPGIGSFSVVQPFEPLGTRFLMTQIANNDVAIAKGDVATIWGRVRNEVTALYAAVLSEEKALDVSKDNLHMTRQLLSHVETRFQSGKALKSDVLRAKIEVSVSQNEHLINEKNLKLNKGSLNLALGRDAESGIVLVDDFSYEAFKHQYEQLKETAFRNRSDLLNEKIRLEQSQKELQISNLETIFPSLAVGFQRTTEEFENDTAIILEASYPLWDLNRGKSKEKQAEIENQKAHYESFQREIGLEVYEVFLEAELADKQVLLQRKALDEANELLRQITTSYEEGEIDFLKYLENIKTIKETRLRYFNTLKKYKEKVADLEQAAQLAPLPGEIK
jgi:cobalt-zinc-cadmium efflux system outer membrane protein